MSRIRFAAIALSAAVLLGACAQDDPTVSEPEATQAAETDEPSDDATLAVADSDLGEILVDGEGRTVYLFKNDEAEKSNCTGACMETWPPLVVEGDPVAGDGVDADELGTIEHDDGMTQVTYHDAPLYHFSGDTAEGDTKGQGIGDKWYVVGEDGEAVED